MVGTSGRTTGTFPDDTAYGGCRELRRHPRQWFGGGIVDSRHNTVIKGFNARAETMGFCEPHLGTPEQRRECLLVHEGAVRWSRAQPHIWNDGGGDRPADGMKANSALLTIMATDRINGIIFFDHLA